jgi:thioredoxin reductase
VPPTLRGIYGGLAVKEVVDYIKSLGVTSVELLPVHAFVQDQHLIDKGLANYWGYGVSLNKDHTIAVGPDFQTGHPGLFCGGDMVPAERTVTVAVGHGKKAARHPSSHGSSENYCPR